VGVGQPAGSGVQPLPIRAVPVFGAGRRMRGHCLVVLPAVVTGGNDCLGATTDAPAADVTLSDTRQAVTLRTQQKTGAYV